MAMRATVLELPATWGEPARVLDEVEARLARGPASDLVVLPEAALAGYVSPVGDFDLAPFGEPLAGPTATRCAAIATSHGVHLVAPLVLREGEALFNAMVGYAPGRAATDPWFIYRKRHPWMPETWATPGAAPHPVVALGGVTLTIAVCYDVHFLADDATLALAAADVLLFPSAWVEQPDGRAAHLLAVARRYDVTVINANWAPGIVCVPGQGGSCIVTPAGQITTIGTTAGRLDVILEADRVALRSS